MAGNSVLSSVLASFQQATSEDWQKAASQETGKENPLIHLSWENADGLKFFPYYDQDTLTKYNSPGSFRLPSKQVDVLGARKWLCAPYVTVSDEEKANKISLDHLNAGAEALFFDISHRRDVDLRKLLRGVEWPFCAIYFQAARQHRQLLHQYISENQLSGKIAGAIFSNAGEAELSGTPDRSFKSLGIRVESSSPVKELVDALTTIAKAIEKTTNDGKELQAVVGTFAVSITIGTEFLQNIAKLKALRWLWFQVAKAYGAINVTPADLHIHAISPMWTEEGYQPHANMIKGTTATMAAVLGGADSISVQPEDENNTTMVRIARNVSVILREEGHLSKVADPTAGSYVLETMTHEFARSAWHLFQNKMNDAS